MVKKAASGKSRASNAGTVRVVMKHARQCAGAMLENAIFIQQELPNVRMDDPTRAATAELCAQLIGTKHDVVHELFDLDDLLSGGATEKRIASAIARIMDWLRRDIRQMHELVTALEAAAKRDRACSSAYMLVSESAVNILNPFNKVKKAADRLAGTVEPAPPSAKA